jgi:hypothetical protein
MSVRITGADGLALGLALTAVGLAWRGHARWALPVACLAVLARETTLLLLASFVAGEWWRHRRGFGIGRLGGPESSERPAAPAAVALLVVPALVGGLWWLALLFGLPGTEFGVHEVAAPLIGLVHATRNWRILGTEYTAPIVWLPIVGALAALGVGAIRRSPFAVPILGQLALLTIVAAPTLDYPQSATRTLLPLTVLVLAAAVQHIGRRSDLTEDALA